MDAKKPLTKQRQLVYHTVLHGDDHPTAADILERLHAAGHRISYATVYNSLRYLTEHGFLRELKVGETVSRYDARVEPHHHIVCRVCGRVDEVFAPIPDAYLHQVVEDTRYRIEDVDLVIHGLCPDCASRTSRDSAESAGH
ncbi:Fur family transcriptional regulator [Alicyclobacillus macrosporangiidus]|uniref:Fur family transcriptional regulator, peroxide stress response regulator n=1 Tax=Alicyclobacillus macrosporangiidus TaxID=392015 RepID=A0A1I7IVR0_9BACL|nr:transcriptional repressor [Alicyclobacillus macrosporangiidus]SFU76962.1 Fur family transcriptional regulator, peroxide stress response regulator [Alicyclobacillus macrosporangiidus]